MSISVKLENFEGPMDLLLHLIEKNKVSIFDIPIAEITEQYLEYIEEMRRQDLDIMSEFLVMAATLVSIKAKMLLPPEVDEEGEEIDTRAELVEKLLEYKMYKYMSLELRERQSEASLQYYKEASLPKEVLAYEEPVEISQLLSKVSLIQLQKVFRDLMRRMENKIDPVRSQFGTIEKEEVTVEDQMEGLLEWLSEKRSASFFDLLKKGRVGHSSSTKTEKIVLFLAILELMKIGEIEISQQGLFGDIIIDLKEQSGNGQVEKNGGA